MMKGIIDIMKEHDIAPSMQRVKILEYLRNYKIHPTADMIYQALLDEMPTLSKTTVYNTLKPLQKKVSWWLSHCSKMRSDMNITPTHTFISNVLNVTKSTIFQNLLNV